MAQFSPVTVAGITLPTVPSPLAAKAATDHAKAKAATASMIEGETIVREAEADYVSTLGTLHSLLPFAKAAKVGQWDFVAAFLGRTKGAKDSGSTITESAASEWCKAAEAVVTHGAPDAVRAGGRKALVTYARSMAKAAKDLTKDAEAKGLPASLAKAQTSATMQDRRVKAAAAAEVMAAKEDAPSAEVIAAEAVAKAVPESAAAAKAEKDAKARAEARTAKAKAEAVEAAKVPAGRVESIEAMAKAAARIREIDMSAARGKAEWSAVAAGLVIALGHAEAGVLAAAVTKAAKAAAKSA